MSQNLPFAIPLRPWEELPSLMGLPSLGEMAAQPLYTPPNRHSSGPKRPRRTSPYGLDFLGRPFGRGEIVLATVGGDYTYVEVEEIFLDDTKGQPYTLWNNFIMDSKSKELFVHGTAEDLDRPGRWNRAMWSLDSDWRPPFLGIVASTRMTYGQSRLAPQGFEAVDAQSFRIRAIPVGIEGASRTTIAPEHISVFGAPLDARTIALHRAAMELPESDVSIPISDPNTW